MKIKQFVGWATKGWEEADKHGIDIPLVVDNRFYLIMSDEVLNKNPMVKVKVTIEEIEK
jgi:hypothetical protein